MRRTSTDGSKRDHGQRDRSKRDRHKRVQGRSMEGTRTQRTRAMGEFRVSTSCFALVTEELARGWMSLAGAMGVIPSWSSSWSPLGPRSSRTATCPAW